MLTRKVSLYIGDISAAGTKRIHYFDKTAKIISAYLIVDSATGDDTNNISLSFQKGSTEITAVTSADLSAGANELSDFVDEKIASDTVLSVVSAVNGTGGSVTGARLELEYFVIR